MNVSHSHDHSCSCTYCGCNSPVVSLLKSAIFSPENLARIKTLPVPEKVVQASTPLLISGGTIRPMIGGSCNTVAAIGIAGGKVVVSGALADVTSFMKQHYPKFSSKTLTGSQTLLPGLIEPHVHIVMAALMSSWLDVSPIDDQTQELRTGYNITWLSKTINANLPIIPGRVLLGNGLDPALLYTDTNEPQVINKDVLDKINAKVPIMILSASGHTLYLNTAGLTHIYNHNEGIRHKYKTLENYLNNSTGMLQEEIQMQPALKSVQTEILEKSLGIFGQITKQFKQANSRGVTFMYDAMMDAEYLAILKPYMLKAQQRVRVGAAKYCTTVDDIKALSKYSPPAKYKDIYYGHIKIVSDGSNQGLTGYQSEPYICDPKENYGTFDFPPGTTAHLTSVPQEYQDMVNAGILKKGWPLMIHANGDQAVTFTITAYQKAINSYKGHQLRHRIEHCSLVGPGQFEQMSVLGISPSFLIGHVGFWGYAFQQKIFGTDKTNTLDLCQSALKSKLRISLHSDHPVTPLGPLRMMEQSITRIMEAETAPKNDQLNITECLTPEQALVAATTDAAWQCYADQWVGSLAAGYFADFIILAKDPLTMPADQISMNMRNIQVMETWINGVPVN
ncbi:MAG TPA: amidohydrolase family protein [Pedobacter sp.]